MLIDGSMATSFSEQLNLCLLASSGKYIARMDDDDYSFPERLEVQLEFLERNEKFAFVGCQTLALPCLLYHLAEQNKQKVAA